VKTKAHAKINLGLRILGRRSDGFHDLVTIFQRISLADELEIELLTQEIIYEGPSLTDRPEDNLCCRAAMLYQAAFGAETGVRIRLTKRIPAGAGLGGGSSDAAAVLKVLAAADDIPIDDTGLQKVAAKVGADVPFFLSGLHSALGQGKGERISGARGLDQNRNIVVIKPEISISTSWAYQQIDNTLTFDKKNIKVFTRYFLNYQGGLPTAEMRNDFEAPIFATHPELANARNRLLDAGAEFSGLCGSGSALFGVFQDRELAERVASGWCSPWLSYVCRPY
jgi:4-diphosphocytidyl-2-C-methyl-D-erythritol kinase